MPVVRLDRSRIGKTERTPEGYLRCDATLARTGVQFYLQPNGTVLREFRPPEEVRASAETIAGKPVALNHPPVFLDSKNTKQYQAGWVDRSVSFDGIYLHSRITLTDAEAIAAAELGHASQVSLGYLCDLDFTPGEWEGQAYDAIQRNIQANHAALVSKGRAGAAVRVHLDGEDLSVAVLLDQDLESGDFVEWESSGGTAKGKITRVITSGDVPDIPVKVGGTSDDPAARIQVFRETPEGWIPTDTYVGHKLASLSKIPPLTRSDMKTPLSKKLHDAMKKKGMEYADLAKEMDISPATVEAVLSGDMEPGDRLSAFAKALGMEEGELEDMMGKKKKDEDPAARELASLKRRLTDANTRIDALSEDIATTKVTLDRAEEERDRFKQQASTLAYQLSEIKDRFDREKQDSIQAWLDAWHAAAPYLPKSLREQPDFTLTPTDLKRQAVQSLSPKFDSDDPAAVEGAFAMLQIQKPDSTKSLRRAVSASLKVDGSGGDVRSRLISEAQKAWQTTN